MSLVARSLVAVFVAAISTVAIAEAVTPEEKASKNVLVDKEPEGAVEVLALKKEAEDKQDVVVVGRIGGRANPWIKGVAAFPIVDNSLRPCNEIEGDACKTPWDYCCESNLPQATVLITLVDENGKPVKQDPRTYLGVKELQTVVVAGKAKRDKAGNVTVLASKVHIRPEK